ncbi:MAG: hypothetical protein HY054_04345, partial [Proteobacteria bacterium]|nr:hypothetical protein [Pseudomonadota bacterium]
MTPDLSLEAEVRRVDEDRWLASRFAPADARARVLVTLPIDEDLGRHLLHALGKAFPDGGVGEGLEFVIKPHP